MINNGDMHGTNLESFVIGGGGLLGSGLTRALTTRGHYVHPKIIIPWHSITESVSTLRTIGESGIPAGSTVYWCAGAGVQGMSSELARREILLFRAFLGALSRDTRVFLASSAGGLYATGSGKSCSESSPVRPQSAYGHCKLALETILFRWAKAGRGTAIVGRIANLYGPGQNLAKPQGIVSHLCRAAISGERLTLYVPRSTRRDFIFIDDAADRIVDSVTRTGKASMLKVICSGTSITIGSVVDMVENVTGVAQLTVSGSSELSDLQSLDVILRSNVLRDVDTMPLTPLRLGVERTWGELLEKEFQARCRSHGISM